MTLKEMKVKVFSLIEEYYPEASHLAEDEDVLNKINGVVNSIQLDLMKYRKIPANTEIDIREKDEKIITLSDEIKDLYQLNKIILVPKEPEIKEDEEETEEEPKETKKYNTNVYFNMIDEDNIELPEDFYGTVKIFYYKYPKMVKTLFDEDEDQDEYDENFKFDIDLMLQEVMPYGVARDILRLDMISVYGTYFEKTYNELKQTLDSRKSAGIINIFGGDDI